MFILFDVRLDDGFRVFLSVRISLLKWFMLILRLYLKVVRVLGWIV